MERSSPLAALRPAPPQFGGQRDLFRSRTQTQFSSNYSTNPIPTTTFNFSIREQFSLNHPEYFSLKNIGSSPTVSLAADLSQNFSITEASPHFPTPRRALFTTSHLIDGSEGREYVTTPPLPASSSPVAMNESMDISPLPHKAPFFSVAQVEIQSPTPAQSPADDMMMESPGLRPAFLEPPKPVVPERKKLGLRRPSLTRTKGFSTSALLTSSRMHPDNQLPAFRFGGSRLSMESSSTMSPSDCFADSPTQDRRPQTANSPCAAAAASVRPRPHFGSMTSLNNVARNNGSPASSHSRRPSNPFMRPRKQFRRSLSMFENPGEITKPKKEGSPPVSTLQSVMDVEEPHEPVLPHFFPDGQNDSIPRISRSTMLEVLDGKYGEHFDQKMIIDCRFEYEYEGGHINGAINYNDKELLSTHLFRNPMTGRTLLIFHCEYSAHRAPIMARHIRAADRTANAECYPRLTYPDVYILDGGYSGFFNEHRDRCYPQAYVEMDHAEHVHTCEREMGRLRQNRKGLNRAATFAFGQQNPSLQDSPTALSRRHSRESDDMLLGASPMNFGNAMAASRRMASY
ncbi:hypothetical protein GE09DRAFT_429028 [Coniochaeta sp. 2T2.1]|nr:hypothetical protein GE09DRAFT_429028 [Coniochaeta sp. 2T2.1]